MGKDVADYTWYVGDVGSFEDSLTFTVSARMSQAERYKQAIMMTAQLTHVLLECVAQEAVVSLHSV